MFDRFYPDVYIKNIYSIDYEKLKELNIHTLVFDLDNTLAPFDIEYPDEKTKLFLDKLVADGFLVLIVSNNALERVTKFTKTLNVSFIHKAGKPKISKIKNFILESGGKLEESAIIGDQLFTDMWVGTRLNILKILVEPIATRDEFTVKLKRGIEKLVFKNYLRKQKNKIIVKKWFLC